MSWIVLVALGIVLFGTLYASPVYAQATRTWVSGVGDDANPCSRTAPCKTWAGAISKTAVGGEIDALDPGGFGAVTITKSITLDGGGGQVASILVSGTNGINVAAGSTDIVVIRNLRFQGILGNGSSPSTAGITAISFTSGARLVVDHCDVYGFNTNGISVALSAAGFVAVSNTSITNVGNAGISVSSSAATGVNVENVHISINKFGVAAGAGNNMTVKNSVLSGSTSAGVETDSGGQMFVDYSEITNNNIGVEAFGTVDLANSDITFNTTGISGATTSFGNNRIFGNTSAGTAPTVGAASSEHGQQ